MKKNGFHLTKVELIVFLIALIVTVSSLTYAFFLSIDEIDNNTATTECFKLSFEDSNDIDIKYAYPLSEEEGNSLSPYVFTIKNTCKNTASYQVNIETLDNSSIKTNNVRIKFENEHSKILSDLEDVTTFVNNNVSKSNKITEGTLRQNEQITYSLRLWLDENSTVEDTADKIYKSKVVVTASPNKFLDDFLMIAYKYDNEIQEVPPEKGIGYTATNVECENATGKWNTKEWGLTVSNITGKVKCNIEFSNTKTKVIELESNGGTLDKDHITRILDQEYGELPTPTKVGYTFEGWYSDAELTNKIISTSIVSNTVNKLYAKYTENTINITSNNTYDVLNYKKAVVNVANTNTATYTPAVNTAANDMGATNSYRYVNTSGMRKIDSTNVKTVSTRGTKVDLGTTTWYQYVNTSGVPNTNSATYTPTTRAANIDMGATNSYRYVTTTSVPNTNSGTYTPNTRAANIDMGATNTYRYVTTTSVPNTNSGTYTYASGSTGGTVDLGATNTYRYVNAANVYSKGVTDADNRANSNSTNYKSGYNAGKAACKSGMFFCQGYSGDQFCSLTLPTSSCSSVYIKSVKYDSGSYQNNDRVEVTQNWSNVARYNLNVAAGKTMSISNQKMSWISIVLENHPSFKKVTVEYTCNY